MSASQERRPTDLEKYYAYRLTRPHLAWASIKPVVMKYSSDWICALHFPDEQESDCMKEHFHFAFRDFDPKKVDAFKKYIANMYDAKGNGLHAGAWRDNHVSRAVGYMKHDERVQFYHSGQSYWDEFIETSETFEKRPEKRARVFKEKLGDPTLTHGNLLKQALKFQQEHMCSELSLQNVLSRMVHQANWIPSRDLIRNGVPREFHEMFADRVTKSTREYAWMAPHVPSEDKARWLDRPDTEPIITRPIGTCPNNSRELFAGGPDRPCNAKK